MDFLHNIYTPPWNRGGNCAYSIIFAAEATQIRYRSDALSTHWEEHLKPEGSSRLEGKGKSYVGILVVNQTGLLILFSFGHFPGLVLNVWLVGTYVYFQM